MSKEPKFVMIPRRMPLDVELSSTAFKLYVLLRWHYSETYQEIIFPSRSRLAKILGRSVDTIDELNKELEKRGYISWEKGHTGYANRYQFPDRFKTIEYRKNAATPAVFAPKTSRTFEEKLAAELRPQPKLENQRYEPEESKESFLSTRKQSEQVRRELTDRGVLRKTSNL